MASVPGLVVAAPASGSGKTVVTLGLLRALARAGHAVASFKVGPDYIDPGFHAAASGKPCFNLDPWAMRPATLARLVESAAGAELAIAEGVMGLFDGALDGSGSTADLAAATGWPVLLVVDVRGQAGSAAALLRGFMTHRRDVRIAGVVFNRVGGEAHAALLRRATEPLGLAVLGLIPRDPALALPERHLGLVQASEHAALEHFLETAAERVGRNIDLDRLVALAQPSRLAGTNDGGPMIPPLGQRIAVASDDAFRFAYPALLEGWRRAGAVVTPFSPLADEAPVADADAVYLPGGYPELHAGRLAANDGLRRGLAAAAARGAAIYGECGGYMLMGRGLVDAQGKRHRMMELLPLETSFAERKLHLGYREIALAQGCALGAAGARYRGHEFHYATVLGESEGDALFTASDAAGRALGPAGRRQARLCGSFLHLIDRADA